MPQTSQKNEKGKIAFSLLAIFTVISVEGGWGNCSQTATNAMLTYIASDLGITVAVGQWLSTSFILALGISVPLAPWFIRRFSERGLLLTALFLASFGALIMIFSPWFWLSLAARVMQALAAGLLLPTMQTMIMIDLPPERRGFFMGINGIAMGFMSNVGPSIGGAMTEALGWRSFFWLYLVLSVLLLFPTLKYARRKADRDCGGFDALSYILCSAAFVLMLLGFSNASSMGITDVLVWLPVMAGAALLVVFVRLQLRFERPLVDMKIFSYWQFTRGFITLCVLYSTFVGVTLVIPLYVTNVYGGTALDSGMVLLPAAVLSFFANFLSGVLMDRFGARKVLLFTGTMLVLGAIMSVFCNGEMPLWYLALSQAVRTLGISGSISPLIAWTLAGLPRELVSHGSAFSTLCRQATASLGTSVMVLMVVSITAAGALEFAYQATFGLTVVLSAVVLVCIVRWIHDAKKN